MYVTWPPRSRGSIYLDPNDPYGAPLVDPNFLDDPEDLAAFVAGIARVRSITRRSSLREFQILAEKLPGDDADDSHSISDAIYRMADTSYHPCGSCSMGPAVSSSGRPAGALNLAKVSFGGTLCLPTHTICTSGLDMACLAKV